MVKEVEKGLTQADFVLDYMKKHGSMSSMEAFDYGITRLAARVHELRKKGYKIDSQNVEVQTKNFGKTTYVKYVLETWQ